MILIVVTGTQPSQVLFPGDLFNESLFQLHRWTAYIVVGLMGIHLLLHWKYLGAMFMAIITRLKNPLVRRTLSESLYVLLIVALVFTGLISNIQYVYDDRLLALLKAEIGAGNLDTQTDDSEEPHLSALEQYYIWFKPLAAEYQQKNDETIEALRTVSEDTTLDGFLGGMFCTLCIRFCPLNAIACGSGRPKEQEAEMVYEDIVSAQVLEQVY